MTPNSKTKTKKIPIKIHPQQIVTACLSIAFTLLFLPQQQAGSDEQPDNPVPSTDINHVFSCEQHRSEVSGCHKKFSSKTILTK